MGFIYFLQVLLNIRELSDCSFILFLNKRDIFRDKLDQYNDFNQYFVDYIRHPDRRLGLEQVFKLIFFFDVS